VIGRSCWIMWDAHPHRKLRVRSRRKEIIRQPGVRHAFPSPSSTCAGSVFCGQDQRKTAIGKSATSIYSPRMTSIWDLASPQLRSLAVYEPGKPIEETARELGIHPAEIVKLASNENPLGPSPKAIEAMRSALDNAHLYPDGSGFYLCKAVAAKLGLKPQNVILGNGSNEIIEFLGHAFVNPGDDVITCQYAFIVYKLLATAFGVRTIETPTPDYQQNLDATLRAITEIGDEGHLRETKRVMDEGRAYLQEQFAEMRIPFVPAVANFVMVNVGDGCAVFQELLRRKIIVRPLKGYGLPEWVRISVGT